VDNDFFRVTMKRINHTRRKTPFFPVTHPNRNKKPAIVVAVPRRTNSKKVVEVKDSREEATNEGWATFDQREYCEPPQPTETTDKAKTTLEYKAAQGTQSWANFESPNTHWATFDATFEKKTSENRSAAAAQDTSPQGRESVMVQIGMSFQEEIEQQNKKRGEQLSSTTTTRTSERIPPPLLESRQAEEPLVLKRDELKLQPLPEDKALVDSQDAHPPQQKRLTVLITKLGRNYNQERALMLLETSKVPYELVDGADLANKNLRNKLFAISGLRAVYPLFFIGEEFLGDFDTIQGIHDASSMEQQILDENPSIITWDRIVGKR